MSEHKHERLFAANDQMLATLWRVQNGAQIVGGRFVLSPEIMRAVGVAIIKAERNHERA